MRSITILCTCTTVAVLLWLASCGGNPYAQGEQLYLQYCANCHQESGEGLARLYPPLKDSDYWKANADQIACIIRNGLDEEITVNGQVFNLPMAAIPQLTEYEIANIINYINHAWYTDTPFASPENIQDELKTCKE